MFGTCVNCKTNCIVILTFLQLFIPRKYKKLGHETQEIYINCGWRKMWNDDNVYYVQLRDYSFVCRWVCVMNIQTRVSIYVFITFTFVVKKKMRSIIILSGHIYLLCCVRTFLTNILTAWRTIIAQSSSKI